MTVPALRFPEFSGEWPISRFDQIGTIIRGASPRPRADPRFYGGDIPRLMVEDVARDGKYVTPNIDYLTEEGATLSRLCLAGTLTVVCSGTAKTVGQPSFLSIDACIHDGFLAITNVDPRVYPDFLFYQIQKFQAQAERLATHGGTFINLTTSILKEFKRAFPEHSEQKKITEFLGVVDAKIATLRDRVAGLERYKRGLMQALFSQSLRFTKPDGTPFPDWEEKRLGEVLREPKKTAVPDYYLRQTLTVQLHTKGLRPSGNTPNETPNPRPYYERHKGELIIGRQNFHNGGIALVDEHHEGLIASNAISSFVAKSGVLKMQFLLDLLSRPDFYRRVGHLIGGTGQKEVSVKEFLRLRISLPHPDEQAKIADALQAMDAKIAAVSSQLTQMQQFKKGLLQQMFV